MKDACNAREPVWTVTASDCIDGMRAIEGKAIGTVIADPPYMLGAASARRSANKAMGWSDIQNASRWYREWMALAWELLSEDGAMWVFGNWRSLPVYQCAASQIPGAFLTSVLIWNKGWLSVGSSRGLRSSYEIVALFSKPKFCIRDRGLSDIWTVKWSGHKPTGHPQEKPVDLIEKLLICPEVVHGAVLDPFAGSGSAGIAAINSGLDYIGFEMERGFCEMATARIGARCESRLKK